MDNIKFRPKGLKFCPGCPSKLKLGAAPKLNIIPEEPKRDTKNITIITKQKNTPKSTNLLS